MLRQLSCYQNRWNSTFFGCFHVITCTGDGCLISVFYWNLINDIITPMQQRAIIGIKCAGRGSFTVSRATLHRRLTATQHVRMPSPPATDSTVVCDDKERGWKGSTEVLTVVSDKDATRLIRCYSVLHKQSPFVSKRVPFRMIAVTDYYLWIAMPARARMLTDGSNVERFFFPLFPPSFLIIELCLVEI